MQYVPDRIVELEGAARSGNLADVRRQAHRLLGLCAQFGAARIAALCASLENIGDEVDRSALEGDIGQLRSEYGAVERWLAEEFGAEHAR